MTVVFLNAILQRTDRERIKDISFSNTESGGEYVEDKQSRLDLLVVTDDGERMNVEIQFTNKYDMIKRSIYYWSGIYRNPLQKRMSYKELSPVISINILNFNVFHQTERFHTTYHLFEDEEKFKLTNVMEFHFIEMPKLIKSWKEAKLDPWNDILARWLLMLGMVDHRNEKVYEGIYLELEELAMKDELLKKAFQNWEELSMTHEEYLAYESRLKHIMDEEAAKREAELRLQEVKEEAEKAIKEGREKGLEQGLEEGREQGREQGREEGRREGEKIGMENEKETIAHRLLETGINIEIVISSTKLPKEKVMEIQREIRE
nr:Rpn family recombination-promoting nuclease/putative transposase [Oceanobacillus piezotolerans]